MKKLPIIRHIRFCYHAIKFHLWWKAFGRHYWLAPNGDDQEYLKAVWEGKK